MRVSLITEYLSPPLSQDGRTQRKHTHIDPSHVGKPPVDASGFARQAHTSHTHLLAQPGIAVDIFSHTREDLSSGAHLGHFKAALSEIAQGTSGKSCTLEDELTQDHITTTAIVIDVSQAQAKQLTKLELTLNGDEGIVEDFYLFASTKGDGALQKLARGNSLTAFEKHFCANHEELARYSYFTITIRQRRSAPSDMKVIARDDMAYSTSRMMQAGIEMRQLIQRLRQDTRH